jgi:hypothetical protein
MKRALPAASLLAGCLLSAGAPAAPDASATSAPLFTLRDTFVGSMIPSDIASSALPFDKTWAELTPQQKDIVRADYESMPAEDEPPYPEKGLKRIVWSVAKRAEVTGDTGKVIAAVTVDGEGKARDVTVYKSPSPEITSLVTANLVTETFKPARCRGQPCTMAFVLRVELLQAAVQAQKH